MELEFCQNVSHVRGNLQNSWLMRLSTEASPAMDMYEERPPEIFTGGYFDQATRMGSFKGPFEYHTNIDMSIYLDAYVFLCTNAYSSTV